MLRAGTMLQMYISRLWRIPSTHLGWRGLKIVDCSLSSHNLVKTHSFLYGVFEEGAAPIFYDNGCVRQPSKEQLKRV